MSRGYLLIYSNAGRTTHHTNENPQQRSMGTPFNWHSFSWAFTHRINTINLFTISPVLLPNKHIPSLMAQWLWWVCRRLTASQPAGQSVDIIRQRVKNICLWGGRNRWSHLRQHLECCSFVGGPEKLKIVWRSVGRLFLTPPNVIRIVLIELNFHTRWQQVLRKRKKYLHDKLIGSEIHKF